jgi:hypothetical protein
MYRAIAAACLVLFTGGACAEPKRDILGVRIGTPPEEAMKRLAELGFRPPGALFSDHFHVNRQVNSSIEHFSGWSTEYYTPRRLCRIEYTFVSGVPNDEMEAKVSQQFGVEHPNKQPSDMAMATWVLGQGILLALDSKSSGNGHEYRLRITDQNCAALDSKAHQDELRKIGTNPKF